MIDILAKLQSVEATFRLLALSNQKCVDPVALVRQHLERGDVERAVGELYQLEFFCKHLDDVRSARSDVFEGLMKRMAQCAQSDNYYGLRMEARIASSMARKGLAFELRERPDFSVDSGAIFIECGSVWPDTSNPAKDYRTRVASAILAKDRQRYATSNTILALENTSVIAAMVDHGRMESDTDFHEFLSQLVSGMDFGSVLLFTTVFSYHTSQIHSAYNRMDSPRIDPRLTAFVETFFPRPGVRIDQPFVPGQNKRP